MENDSNGSLLEGIEFEKRKTVDADWSKAKRIAVGSVAALLAAAAIGVGGWFAWQSRPVGFPETTEQALAMVKSGRIDRLPADRQRQWYAEAAPLLQDISREEWQTNFDEEDRRAAREIGREMFAESIREVARGNQTPQEMFAGMMRSRPNNGERQRPQGGSNNEGEGDRPSRADRQAAFRGRLQNAFQNGDAQRTGLMGEFFTMMRAQREASGAQGGRPGGRPGGGG